MRVYKSILIIDDDLVSSFLNKQVIQEMKLADHTLFCRNGEEALSYIKETCNICGEPDCTELVLLDLKMPRMDGLEFLNELEEYRNRSKNQFKVIVVTSSERPQDKRKVENFKIDGFISKPLTADKLQEVVW